MKLQFVTTSAVARDPQSKARLVVESTEEGWTWQVIVQRPCGADVRVGRGKAQSDAAARGAARKCLARYLESRASTETRSAAR